MKTTEDLADEMALALEVGGEDANYLKTMLVEREAEVRADERTKVRAAVGSALTMLRVLLSEDAKVAAVLDGLLTGMADGLDSPGQRSV